MEISTKKLRTMRPKLNNILIIDDNNNDLELAQHYLNKKFDDLMFMVASSKKDFVEKFSWLKPDLIISDFDLPDCTGLDLLIMVRKESEIPFIFMSGTLDDNDESLSKTILNGANGYVLKDKIKKLPNIVEHVMENEYAKRQLQEEKDIEFNKIKLKLSKGIEMIKNGASEQTILSTLNAVKAELDEL